MKITRPSTKPKAATWSAVQLQKGKVYRYENRDLSTSAEVFMRAGISSVVGLTSGSAYDVLDNQFVGVRFVEVDAELIVKDK